MMCYNFFFFNDTATTEIYTLSLHDALPILAASVLQALGFALFNPARMAFLAELVPRTAVPTAVSLLLVNAEVNRVIGPAIAGLVIGSVTFGPPPGLLAPPVLSPVRPLLPAGPPPGRAGRQ